MTIENQDLINQVAGILGSASDAVISEYVVWHLTAAIAWIVAGSVAFVLLKNWDTDKTNWAFPPKLVKIVAMCITGMIVISYVPDLVSPKAVSINQLLHDLN